MARDINPDIEEYIKSIKIDLEELKNRQIIGADSLLIYRLQSGVPYDKTFTLLTGNTKRFDVIYYAREQDWFFYNFNANLFMGATFETAVKIPYYSINIAGNLDYKIAKQVRIPYYINNFTGSTQTYWIKFYIQASDKGLGIIDITEYF